MLVGQSLTKFKYPLLVNSYGRSGSTVLANSIVSSSVILDNDYIKRLALWSALHNAWDITSSNLKKGLLYKTHDLPPQRHSSYAELRNRSTRMLYTFGDPVEVIISLIRLYESRGDIWMSKHFSNLKAEAYFDFLDIINEDILGLENHFKSWLEQNKIPTAFIRYETMWSKQKEISDFLGIDLKLPAYRERNSKEQKDLNLRSNIKATYAKLIDLTDQAEDFFILGI
ncbi:hypothetical protein BST97_07040 [Nonlabens spongiae]|uniref:Sulfotransferase domain-containing protein n=2 Tax=Nonlabens spongiae TaxID=331648 RepID=A0A1W6MJM4_9FLAO|nr:hypothetical protein BST97_07040 [Nonlabens spongiae]